MESFSVAEVVDSKHPSFNKGDLVMDTMPWRSVQLHTGQGGYGQKLLRKLDPTTTIPLTAYVGVLGMPGWTAFFGLNDQEVGRFKAGQTILVSGAAGAVGSLVGQLARIDGASKVIGIAGGPDKCRLMKDEFAFDECIDYKAVTTKEQLTDAIKQAAPDGVDLYFDNVGGITTAAALLCMKRFGRIVLCGNISSSSKDPKDNLIPDFLPTAIYRALTLRGLYVGDYLERVNKEFYPVVEGLIKDGKVKYEETVWKGFDKVPEAFEGLFKGLNTGKAVITVD
jgi:NADPH-dependent curcumin reductase CurA